MPPVPGITPPPGSSGGSGGKNPTFAATAPSSHNGWANLRWSVNHRIPGALRETQRINLATRYSLIRAYRIR